MDKKEYQRRYYQNHKKTLLQKAKQYREKNRDNIKRYMKKYSLENKEKKEQYDREYRQKNKEKRKQYMKNYNKKYYTKNKDILLKRQKNRYQKNRDKILEYHSKRHQKIRNEWTHIIKKYYGEIECPKCGFNENIFSAYDFHHRNPKEKEHLISRLVRYKPTPERIEILKEELQKGYFLCATCHRIIHSSESE